MDAKNELLDAARKVCSTDAEIARRLKASRQLVNNWRKGVPMKQERIVQLARLAHENEGYWLARIEAEQSQGETRRAWEQVVTRLSQAACLGIVLTVGFAHIDAAAHNLNDGLSKHYAQWLKVMRETLTRLKAWFRHELTASSPVLASR